MVLRRPDNRRKDTADHEAGHVLAVLAAGTKTSVRVGGWTIGKLVDTTKKEFASLRIRDRDWECVEDACDTFSGCVYMSGPRPPRMELAISLAGQAGEDGITFPCPYPDSPPPNRWETDDFVDAYRVVAHVWQLAGDYRRQVRAIVHCFEVIRELFQTDALVQDAHEAISAYMLQNIFHLRGHVQEAILAALAVEGIFEQHFAMMYRSFDALHLRSIAKRTVKLAV